MDDMFLLNKLQESIIGGNIQDAKRLTIEAISKGTDPFKLLNETMMPSLAVVGTRFESGELFLPELVRTGEAASLVADEIQTAITKLNKKMPIKGIFAVGTVKDDVHSIGKNLVSMMMKVNGFSVIDLGVDVAPEEFLNVAKDVNAIGLSALLTLALRNMEKTIKLVSNKYPKVKIIIGGAATDPKLAKEFGVIYGADAAICPKIIETEIK